MDRKSNELHPTDGGPYQREEDLEVMFAESKEKRMEITIQGTTRLDERRMRQDPTLGRSEDEEEINNLFLSKRNCTPREFYYKISGEATKGIDTLIS